MRSLPLYLAIGAPHLRLVRAVLVGPLLGARRLAYRLGRALGESLAADALRALCAALGGGLLAAGLPGGLHDPRGSWPSLGVAGGRRAGAARLSLHGAGAADVAQDSAPPAALEVLPAGPQRTPQLLVVGHGHHVAQIPRDDERVFYAHPGAAAFVPAGLQSREAGLREEEAAATAHGDHLLAPAELVGVEAEEAPQERVPRDGLVEAPGLGTRRHHRCPVVGVLHALEGGVEGAVRLQAGQLDGGVNLQVVQGQQDPGIRRQMPVRRARKVAARRPALQQHPQVAHAVVELGVGPEQPGVRQRLRVVDGQVHLAGPRGPLVAQLQDGHAGVEDVPDHLEFRLVLKDPP
mmetsp:Transcript_118173/g.320741  ORF Transcript_118173/g.320741 Transcript_118173/m.320741 type:complete len:349 (+) Transcript_118173:90-1136(+)